MAMAEGLTARELRDEARWSQLAAEERAYREWAASQQPPLTAREARKIKVFVGKHRIRPIKVDGEQVYVFWRGGLVWGWRAWLVAQLQRLLDRLAGCKPKTGRRPPGSPHNGRSVRRATLRCSAPPGPS